MPSSFEDICIPSFTSGKSHQQQQQECASDNLRPFGKVYEASRIGETLKDIIVKSISEKMKFSEMESTSPLFPLSEDLYSQAFLLADPPAYPFDFRLTKSAFRSCSRSEISQACHPPAKRIKREPSDEQDSASHLLKQSVSSRGGVDSQRSGLTGENRTSSSQTGNGSTSSRSKHSREGSMKEKKTRPKRGQYRKYNSQLLIEAVRAVQRGEMSVHRAGSYFGVPHSTLEYKVKERHLLRQKKPREGGSGSNSSSGSSSVHPPASGCSATACANSSSSTMSSTTQTKKASYSMTSIASSDSSCSSSSQAGLAGGDKREDSPLTSSPAKSAAPPSSSSATPPARSLTSLSALGFGLPSGQTPATREDSGAEGDRVEFPSWFPPYLVSGASSLTPFHPAALSLFPSRGFAVNNSASELLRKLQHKVQSKSSSPPLPFSPESSFGFSHHRPNGSRSLREGFMLFN